MCCTGNISESGKCTCLPCGGYCLAWSTKNSPCEQLAGRQKRIKGSSPKEGNIETKMWVFELAFFSHKNEERSLRQKQPTGATFFESIHASESLDGESHMAISHRGTGDVVTCNRNVRYPSRPELRAEEGRVRGSACAFSFRGWRQPCYS